MSDTITVYSPDGVEVVTTQSQDLVTVATASPATNAVTVTVPSTVAVEQTGLRGPQGPSGQTGPAGPAGVSGGSYTQNFAVASDTWTAVHNLGFIPNVGLLDSLGRGMRGHVESNDEITTVVTFYTPVSGRIILS